MPALASLDPTEIGFYAAVATIIPVFLLAYVVGLNKILGQTPPRRGRSTEAEAYLQLLETFRKRERWGGAAVRALGALLIATAYNVLLLTLFFLGVALPSLGEYGALHALYVDRSSFNAKSFGLIGALTAGAIVIAPVAWTTLTSYLQPSYTMFKTLFAAIWQPAEGSEPAVEQPPEKEPPPQPGPPPEKEQPPNAADS